MNRRDLIKSMLGVTVAAWVTVATPRHQFGTLSVDGWRAHKELTGEALEVFVDGVQVTSAYEASDVDGYVLAYCRDEQHHRDWSAQGHLHIGGDGGACRMRLTGTVVIRPGARRG
jgi:hypothetical protein